MTTATRPRPAGPVLFPRPPRRPSALARDLIGAAVWASMLVVVALWVAAGGVTALAGPAAAVTSAGRLAGLVAADLLLVQVLLMARIPVVERSYGQDELARRHRLVGFWSFWLMVAHLVAITVGYALEAGANPLVQFWEMVVDYPGMLLALAGTVALAGVTVTSIRRARRRLRYESWHLLHLYAYLGVALALPHQLWTGRSLTSTPLAAVYWWTLWGAAAAAILVWRVGLPLYRSWRHDLRVETVVREAPGVVSVWLRGRDLHRLPVAAGQFLTWRFRSGPGWTRGHPYSLSAAPTGQWLRITVKDLGDDSARVADLVPGTRALFEGPYGRLHGGVRTRRKVALIGAGIGITPLRALLEELPQWPGDVTLIQRAGTADDLVLAPEIAQLAADRGARVYQLVGPRRSAGSWLPASAGDVGDAEALRQLVPDIAGHDVYLCGAPGWMAAVRESALACGVPAECIHLERFAW